MPTIIDFKGRNVIFAEHQPEYQNLPALMVDCGGYAEVYSCWEFSEDELVRMGNKFFLKQVIPFYLDEDGNKRLSPMQPIMPLAELGDDIILMP